MGERWTTLEEAPINQKVGSEKQDASVTSRVTSGGKNTHRQTPRLKFWLATWPRTVSYPNFMAGILRSRLTRLSAPLSIARTVSSQNFVATRSLGSKVPAYEGHIPVNWFENGVLAVGSAFMSLADPRRGGESTSNFCRQCIDDRLPWRYGRCARRNHRGPISSPSS